LRWPWAFAGLCSRLNLKAAATSSTELDLYAVISASRDRGWAVGEGGVILERSGRAWRVALSPTGDDLYGATVDGQGRGRSVGNVRGILRYLPGTCLPLVLKQTRQP
jgi:hypothetical protein